MDGGAEAFMDMNRIQENEVERNLEGLNFKSLAVACSWTHNINSVANCAKRLCSETVAETSQTLVKVIILINLSGWVSEMVQGYSPSFSLYLLGISA